MATGSDAPPHLLARFRNACGALLLPQTKTGKRIRLPTLELWLVKHGCFGAKNTRPLNEAEIALAQSVFHEALDYARIRIAYTSVVSAPTTLGDVIRTNGDMSDTTLVHELMHVWQFQTRGTAYISDSICHQLASLAVHGHRGGAYRLTGADVLAACHIDDLSAEQQAVLVERWFENGTLQFYHQDASQTRSLSSHRPVRQLPQCQELLAQIRAAQPLPSDYIRAEALGLGPSILTRLLRLEPSTSFFRPQ